MSASRAVRTAVGIAAGWTAALALLFLWNVPRQRLEPGRSYGHRHKRISSRFSQHGVGTPGMGESSYPPPTHPPRIHTWTILSELWSPLKGCNSPG